MSSFTSRAAVDVATAPVPAAPQQPRDRWRRPYVGAIVAVLVVGVGLRVYGWWRAQPFWYDELSLAVNLRRGYGHLIGPLSHRQHAPIGWLWIEHAFYTAFGDGERALRFMPMLFGCLTLGAVLLLAHRLLARPSTLGVLAAAALCPNLVTYSAELKQYSSDAFWIPLLCGLALMARRRGARRPWLWGWWLAAAAAAWFSHAAILAVPLIAVALLCHVVRCRGVRAGVMFALAGVPFGLSALWDYYATLRGAGSSIFLKTFWANGFPPPSHHPVPYVTWLGARALGLAHDPLHASVPWLAVTLIAVGTVRLARRDRTAAFLILSPIITGYIFATVGVYPLASRLALYVLPEALVLAGFAVDRIRPIWRPTRRGTPWIAGFVAWCALATLIIPRGFPPHLHTFFYRKNPNTPAAFAYVAHHVRPGDEVLVHFDSRNAARWYAPQEGLRWDASVRMLPRSTGCAPGQLRHALSGHQRAWLVAGYRFGPPPPRDEIRILRAHLRSYGTERVAARFTGVTVYRYDLSRPDRADQAAKLPHGSVWSCVRVAPAPPDHAERKN